MKKQTFILMKTKNPKEGMIYEMIHLGGKVLFRKSLGIKIPYKYWDSEKKESKPTYSYFSEVNSRIKNKIRTFEMEIGSYVKNSENECFIEFMESHMHKNYDNIQTVNKYDTVLKNVKHVMITKFKRENLPFYLLRERTFLEELKNAIRHNQHNHQKLKSNNAWKNYMNIIGYFIQEWNVLSNTPEPINHYFLNKGIEKSPLKKAPNLSHQELNLFFNYVPIGRTKKNRKEQLDAKNMFTFQYFTGGKRLVDILLLCNTDFKDSYIEIKIKKTKQMSTCEYYPEMFESIKNYYPEIYESVNGNIKLKNIKTDLNVIKNLLRIDNIEELMEKSLDEFVFVVDDLKNKNYQTYSEISDTLNESLNNLRTMVMKSFFNEVSKLPKHFIFPYLNINDFNQEQDSLEFLTRYQVKLITDARKKYNRHLNQISTNLGITTPIRSHSARHTIANQLYQQGFDISDIQQVLSHSSITTTQKYVFERLSDVKSQNVLRKSFKEGFSKT